MNNQKPVRGMQINKTHPLSKGLVGAWIFNEATGDKVFDLSGSANHGTLVGKPDWVPDGLDFVAANSDYVSLTGLTVGTTYSMIFGGIDIDITGYMFDSNNGRIFIYSLGSDIYFWDGASTKIVTGFPSQTFDLSITFDGSGVGTAKSYINGILKTSTDAYDPVPIGGNVALYSKQDGTGNYSDGRLKYFYFYNRALSPSEVAWLNREPYAMFQQPINPAFMYYEAPTGFNPAWARNINNLLGEGITNV